MRCPFCEETDTRAKVHAHLVDAHFEEVRTDTDGWGRSHMEVTCPACGESYRAQVKPRGRDPRFVEEHSREIRIVAFDALLYHWQGAHGEEASGE